MLRKYVCLRNVFEAFAIDNLSGRYSSAHVETQTPLVQVPPVVQARPLQAGLLAEHWAEVTAPENGQPTACTGVAKEAITGSAISELIPIRRTTSRRVIP